MVRKRCPTQHRHKSVPVGHKAVTVQGGHGAVFAFISQFLLGLRVSRYKFDRSQETVTMQDYNCGHWSGVGLHFYKGHDIESRIAKTVTSL
jgi:hypothetical protein